MGLHEEHFDLSDKTLARDLGKKIKALPDDVQSVTIGLRKSSGGHQRYGWVAWMRYESDKS